MDLFFPLGVFYHFFVERMPVQIFFKFLVNGIHKIVNGIHKIVNGIRNCESICPTTQRIIKHTKLPPD